MNILVIGEKLFTDYALQALDDTAHMVDVYYWDGTFGPELLMDSGINDYDSIVVMFDDDKLSADITVMIKTIVTNDSCTVFDYILWSMGGAWADEDWNVTIDSQETRDALNHLKEIQDYADPSILSWGTEESIKAFLDGNAAICETWPTLVLVQAADDESQSKVAGKWALSTIPYDKTGTTLLSAWDVSIPAASKNQELAWEWVKMYTSAEKQNQFYDDFGILSPRKAFWERDGIKGTYMDTVREALDTANIWWRIPASTEVDSMLNTVVSQYMTGEIDLETAVSKMKKGIEEALKNAPPEEGTKNYNM